MSRFFGVVHRQCLPGLAYRVTPDLFKQPHRLPAARALCCSPFKHNFKYAYASDGRSITRAQRIISAVEYRQQMNQVRDR